MREGRVLPLDEVCNVEYGTRVVRKQDSGSTYPVYGGGGATFKVDLFNREDRLILSRFAMSDQCTRFVHGKFFLNDSGLTVSPKNGEMLPRYLDYQLLSLNGLIYSLGRGTAQKNLDLTAFRIMPLFVLNDLEEQRRIVALLDEAFDGIAAAKANAEKNLRNARAIFESYLSHVFTECARYPETPIGDVAKVYDGPHATPKTIDHGPIFLGISALQDGIVNLTETKHVSQEDFVIWTRRIKPQADDVVFSYETRLGQAAIIPAGLECCLGRRMALVRVNPNRLNPRFFVNYFVSPVFRAYLASRTVRGATVDRISVKDFPSFTIKLPPLSEQLRIIEQIDALSGEIRRIEAIYRQKLIALAALKSSLLHHAFAGEL